MPENQESGGTAAAEMTLLDKIIYDGKMARDEDQRPFAKDLLGEFVNQILDEGMTVSKDTFASINFRIAQIDDLISKQLNDVMHSDEFQKLEGSWRGLHYLVSNSETGSRMKLRLLNVTKAELLDNLEKATESRPERPVRETVRRKSTARLAGYPYTGC